MPDDTNQPDPTTTPPSDQPTDQQDIEPALEESAEITKQKAQQDPAFSQTLAATSDLQNMVIDIEKDLLAEIIKNLDENKMTPESAEKLAKEFLALLPIKDQRDLLSKLTKLNQENKNMQDIYLKYAKPQEEEERQKRLDLISQHIKNGDIENALAVAKGGTNG